MKLVYLKWVDAAGPSESGWLNDEELLDHLGHELQIEEVGWIVQEDKEYICLVSGCAKEPEGSEWNSIYHHLIKIPRACIRKKVDLTKHIK